MYFFKVCGLEEEINVRSYSKIEFFCDIFFLNIVVFLLNLRDVLILYVLDVNRVEFFKLMKLYVCILVLLVGENFMLFS